MFSHSHTGCKEKPERDVCAKNGFHHIYIYLYAHRKSLYIYRKENADISLYGLWGANVHLNIFALFV